MSKTKTIRVVAAVFARGNNEVLIFRRASHEVGPGKWEFPGGKVEDGESDQQALKREIQEELQVDIEVGPLLASGKHAYPQITIDLYAYLVEYDPQATFHFIDHDKMEWVDQQKMSQFDIADADVPIAKEVFFQLKKRLK